MNWTIDPSSSLRGVVSMPGDKSISHRALMHATLAQGTSCIQNFLHAGVTDAMMGCVRDLGVTLIAYSPIAKGTLTGKYTPENIPPGMRRRTYSRDYLARIQPLISVLKEIGQAHGDKTPSQVSLNWLVHKGAVPIPGAKNGKQAKENAEALKFSLTEDEVDTLAQATLAWRA